MDARTTKDLETFQLLPRFAPSRQAEDIVALRIAAQRARDEAIAAGLRRFFRGVGTWVAVLGETLASWPRRRRTYEDLRALTDRELADIGLTRGEIGRVFEPDFKLPARPAANSNVAAKPAAA